MKKRVFSYCALGFLIGVLLVLLVPVLSGLQDDGSLRLIPSALIARAGSARGALALSFLVFGCYSMFCIGGMLLYEIERWPLALATVVHYLGIALGYPCTAWLLCWGLGWGTLLVIEGFMAAGFVLIWLFMYLRWKKEVRELNELTAKRNKKNNNPAR